MKVTLSVLKADIGSVGGHTLPSRKVLAKVEEVVREEVGRLLLDAYVFHIGDDIVLLQPEQSAAVVDRQDRPRLGVQRGHGRGGIVGNRESAKVADLPVPVAAVDCNDGGVGPGAPRH